MADFEDVMTALGLAVLAAYVFQPPDEEGMDFEFEWCPGRTLDFWRVDGNVRSR